jgi:hypothetical protein
VVTTRIKGNQIFDGTIKSEDIDDSLEKEFTKVRVTTDDSTPDFLYSKFITNGSIVANIIGISGSAQLLALSGTAAGSNTQLQFNNGGSFGASANLNFDSLSNTLSLTGSFGMMGNIVPDADHTYTLGTEQKRWQHVYTGDLHLRNDRGDWTIVEERDYLCVVNNITGKKYKMMLQPLDNE